MKYIIDGTDLTRTSDRVYTHAVIVTEENGEVWCYGFCGSKDLAEKLTRTYEREIEKGWRKKTSKAEVRAVKVQEPKRKSKN